MAANEDLRSNIVRVAQDGDMDLVGFASVDRFSSVHYRMRPEAHLPGAKTVISIGMRYPMAMYERAGKGASESYFSMDGYENFPMINTLMMAAMDVTRYVEKRGFLAIPTQAKHYRVHPYKDIPDSWTQDFPNELAATAAGLGELGLHGRTITPQYGTRQRFLAIITDAQIAPDPLYKGDALCDKCMKCVDKCWVQAFDGSQLTAVQVGERTFEQAKLDPWRCHYCCKFMLISEAGPATSGLNVTIPPPAVVTEADIQKGLSDKGAKGGLQTWYTYASRACERECIPPHLRGVQTGYEDTQPTAQGAHHVNPI
ncbi:MAG: hypothetical protein WD042_18435 [Phycisphaeraceae bacterium]